MITFDSEFTLYDLHEVADRTGLSRSKISKLVRDSTLAAVHHNGKWMVCNEELDRFRRSYRSPGRFRPIGVPRRFVPPPRPADVGGEAPVSRETEG